MYPDPYRSGRPYTGLHDGIGDRCPICDTTGACPDAAAVPMPYPPVDPDSDETAVAGGPLQLYAVTLYGTTTQMRLNTSDAARYGDAAALIA